MDKIFISYSRADHHFAELLRLKLNESEFNVWLDHGNLRAGEDWRSGIERGIQESSLLLVVMSEESSNSPYVTFEWAYAMGQGKAVLPLRIKPCEFHPRLEPIQYLDFSSQGEQPWERLAEVISETLNELEVFEDVIEPIEAAKTDIQDPNVTHILRYLNSRGFQMVSFDRLRDKGICKFSDTEFAKLITSHRHIFRSAILKGGVKGLAKL